MFSTVKRHPAKSEHDRLRLVLEKGASLDILSSEYEHELDVEKMPIVIGRDPSVDVHLKDSTVSRAHCEIRLERGHIVVFDLSSRNGTRVNGQAVNTYVLQPGDVVGVGFAELHVKTCSRACQQSAKLGRVV